MISWSLCQIFKKTWPFGSWKYSCARRVSVSYQVKKANLRRLSKSVFKGVKTIGNQSGAIQAISSPSRPSTEPTCISSLLECRMLTRRGQLKASGIVENTRVVVLADGTYVLVFTPGVRFQIPLQVVDQLFQYIGDQTICEEYNPAMFSKKFERCISKKVKATFKSFHDKHAQ